MSQPLCRVCGAKATQTCGQCSISLYCGQECANTDWEHGYHARICSDADDLHTEALPLARRLFMESSLPTVDPEDRAEALELVDSLLMEHCAEEFFMENPHLIDEYLDQEEDHEELIGASFANEELVDEDEHLLNDLAEIRGEALAWLDDVHVHDAEDYHMIGAEFGKHAQHWHEEYERMENKFTDFLSRAGQAVKHGAQKVAEVAKKAAGKAKELAGKAGAAIRKGAKSAASRLRGARDNLKSRVLTKKRAISSKRARRRAEKKGMFKTKRNPTGKPMMSRRARSQQRRESRRQKREARQQTPSNRRSSSSDASSSSSSGSADSYSSSDEIAESPPVSPRHSRSAERRAQKAEEKARRQEDENRRQAEESEMVTRGRSQTRADEEYYRSRSAEKRQKKEEGRLAREAKDAARRQAEAQQAAAQAAAQEVAAANAARRKAEQDATAAQRQANLEVIRRRRAELAQNPVYQPSTARPTVVVVPQAIAPAPAPASVPVAPRADVRTKRDSLNQKAMNLEQQQRYYQDEIRQLKEQIYRNQQAKAQLEQKLAAPSVSEIEKHDWDSEMRRLVGRIQMDTQTMKETQQKVAAAQVQRDQIVQQLQQLPTTATMTTCISWK